MYTKSLTFFFLDPYSILCISSLIIVFELSSIFNFSLDMTLMLNTSERHCDTLFGVCNVLPGFSLFYCLLMLMVSYIFLIDIF